MSISETLKACVLHLPEDVLKNGLERNGISTDVPPNEGRSRLMNVHTLSTSISYSAPGTRQDKLPSLAWVQSIIESTFIDIKSEMQRLTDEIAEMKSNVNMGATGIEEQLHAHSKDMK